RASRYGCEVKHYVPRSAGVRDSCATKDRSRRFALFSSLRDLRGVRREHRRRAKPRDSVHRLQPRSNPCTTRMNQSRTLPMHTLATPAMRLARLVTIAALVLGASLAASAQPPQAGGGARRADAIPPIAERTAGMK